MPRIYFLQLMPLEIAPASGNWNLVLTTSINMIIYFYCKLSDDLTSNDITLQ